MSEELSRRRFLKDTALLAGAMAAMHSVDGSAATAQAPAAMPKIRLGHVEVSRLILGTNPFFGYAHQDGDLGQQMKEYYTDQRIMQSPRRGGRPGRDGGLRAALSGVDPAFQQVSRRRRQVDHLDRPAPRVAQENEAGNRLLRQGGAKAVFIQGHRVEEQFEKNTFDVVRGWLEHIKSHGMAAGMASHRPDIHPVAEKQGFPTDFYFQCFFRVDQHPENYALECRDKAVETIRSITAKPVVAYKILGRRGCRPKRHLPTPSSTLPPRTAFVSASSTRTSRACWPTTSR